MQTEYMPHPYRKFEGRAVWRALDAEIAELEATGDLILQTTRPYVIGALCKRLDLLGLLLWDRASAIALALVDAGWGPAVDEGPQHHAMSMAGMADERLIADYLRVTEAQWAGKPPEALTDYLPLARKLLEAERREEELRERAT